jgi:hypothetical protein
VKTVQLEVEQCYKPEPCANGDAAAITSSAAAAGNETAYRNLTIATMSASLGITDLPLDVFLELAKQLNILDLVILLSVCPKFIVLDDIDSECLTSCRRAVSFASSNFKGLSGSMPSPECER